MNTSYNELREAARLNNYENSRVTPYRYVFVLTNLCNLKCSFCFQDKNFNKDSLSLQEWKNIIVQLPEGSHITLTGGEPLLFKELEELIKFIPKSISFNLITNGLLLTENITDYLLKFDNFKVLSVSIDDIGNLSRDFTAKNWQDLISNVKYFIKQRAAVGSSTIFDVKSVVHSKNQSKICALSSFVSEQLKADTHMFMFLKGTSIQHSDVMYDYSLCFYENNRYEDYNQLKLEEELSKLGELAKINTSTQIFPSKIHRYL